ncbi:hypothetical protein C347_01525 [Cryptococcus neoformans AD2-60a]|uniref:Uncharacterized protein n=1 Tax=Cryptococcus neoformans (strain H99 / ATCC 208821 / CBS 10515 / FGSC 9487) TaxID=235443 RepID=J9VJG8_CRYN9|nr:hypothetical protein CNAG_07493 [Cryptococcus neoformans var. grubii H99]AFR93561.1 hypothetical protein CNAG_07493 [Cryptococcus neoformans var. grubii H99]AUB23117.1 hypothetical protein CKF44_07493 [Cryptococcus neoformans var. grubii]OWZ34957.1 hypothetical protein C347_01525 [Cryptococcus neoformans var. grubii AD2-60a]OXG44881.1 hypothetical protein C359_01056 [Cryptococcus neoformans var. grubii Bt120]|eukprot:XP_012047765.1 hypothetical protein CNAG_07493 [Cryptococcus neoformans var. grubii H99]
MCSASHTPARPSRAAQNPNTARRDDDRHCDYCDCWKWIPGCIAVVFARYPSTLCLRPSFRSPDRVACEPAKSCTWCRSKDGGDAEKRAKAAVHCRQLPDYNEEEAPDGFFLKDGRIFWRSNWSNLRCALRGDVIFENLVSTAVKKCLQDDQFVQTKSKPTNNELRGRVVDYLNSVVREKKKAEVKKKTEARMKNVKRRTMRFRAWLISNWKDTPLDGCKERDLFKRALLSERGVLRNLHFLEHNEIEDVLKRVAERRSNSAGDNDDEDDDDVYDEFLLLADAYYGSKVERPTVVVVPCNKSAMLSGLDTKAGYKPKARQNAGQLPSSTCLINTIIRSPWVSASRPVQPAS